MEAEALVPQFSVERILKPKIAKTKGKKVVIVCVVDVFDFDSSLPVEELKSVQSSPHLPRLHVLLMQIPVPSICQPSRFFEFYSGRKQGGSHIEENLQKDARGAMLEGVKVISERIVFRFGSGPD